MILLSSSITPQFSISAALMRSLLCCTRFIKCMLEPLLSYTHWQMTSWLNGWTTQWLLLTCWEYCKATQRSQGSSQECSYNSRLCSWKGLISWVSTRLQRVLLAFQSLDSVVLTLSRWWSKQSWLRSVSLAIKAWKRSQEALSSVSVGQSSCCKCSCQGSRRC